MFSNISEASRHIFTKHGGVVAASSTGVALGLTSTVTTVFSLFLVPLSEEFDAPRASISIVLLIVALANAIVYPIIGRLGDRIGARIVVLSGLLLFSASLAATSHVQNLTQLYFAYALMGVSGSVLGPILFTKIVAGWFDETRGFFLGFVGGVGNGVGSTLMPIFVLMLMSDDGWRFAYQGLSLLVLVLGAPFIFLLLRDPPNFEASNSLVVRDSLGLNLEQVVKTKTFWLMLSAIALCTGCMMSVFTHVVPILTDQGISPQSATAVLATFAMVTVGAQVAVGAILDRLDKPRAIAPLFVVAAGGAILMLYSDSFNNLLISAVLMGFGLGAEFGLLPYGISRYFGLKYYGIISGVMYGVVAITNGFMPVVMDVIYDLKGNYELGLIAAALGMLFGAGLIFHLPKFGIVGSESQHERDR
jgi:MFS family permease